MHGFERKAGIADLLERSGAVEVAALSRSFGVCRETIRRDLRELEKAGVVKRTHGGALIETDLSKAQPEFPFSFREVQRQEEKLAICRRAAAMIADGDTVFMDNSSTTSYLLRYIGDDIRACVLTNSLKLLIEAVRLRKSNLRFICLGGELNEGNLSFSGAIPQRIGGEYFPDKAFMSCASISESRMLADSSADEVDTKRLMVERSREVVILADHTKFARSGQVFLASFSDIDRIVTDGKAEEATLERLRSLGATIVVAD